jgi:hypothetical protein
MGSILDSINIINDGKVREKEARSIEYYSINIINDGQVSEKEARSLE